MINVLLIILLIIVAILIVINICLTSINTNIIMSTKGVNSTVKKGGTAITHDGNNGSIDVEEYLRGIYFNSETGKLTIHSNITEIGDNAFESRQEIKSINIIDRPNALIIGDHAFYDCNITGELTIPPCVLEINTGAFFNNRNLTSINIIDRPNALIIGDHAFYDCDITGELIIPSCISEIEENAFSNNGNLTSINIINRLNPLIIGNGAFIYCGTTGELIIPPCISKIGHHAFSCNFLLKSINIINRPNPLIIGYWTFYNCNITGELIIPPCVSKIGNHAFGRNRNLTSVNIIDRPDNLLPLIIGESAFAYCIQLGRKLDLTYVSEIGNNAFQNTNLFKYVVLSPQMYANRTTELPRIGIRVIDDDDQRIIEFNPNNSERRQNAAALGNAINQGYINNDSSNRRVYIQEADDDIVYGLPNPIPLSEIKDIRQNGEKKRINTIQALGVPRLQAHTNSFLG